MATEGAHVVVHSPGDADIDWPLGEEGAAARRWLGPLIVGGPGAMMTNAPCDIGVVRTGDVVLPYTVTRAGAVDTDDEASFVASLFAHYVVYPRAEAERMAGAAAGAVVGGLLRALAPVARRAGLDRAVLVNNWLVSTNLYPPGVADVAPAVTRALVDAFPDRPIVWRSVDARGNPALVAALDGAGCRRVFARQVWYQDPATVLRRKQTRADRSLLRRSPYRLVDGADLAERDVPRLAALYRRLYLEKYPRQNPQLTDAFIAGALADGRLRFRAFAAPGGRIDAVLGSFARGGFVTQPVFGYDTSLPAEAALYRLLSVQAILDAADAGRTVHASAGVGAFKRVRGGEPAVEWHAAATAHLAPDARRAWAVLGFIANRAVAPIVVRRGL